MSTDISQQILDELRSISRRLDVVEKAPFLREHLKEIASTQRAAAKVDELVALATEEDDGQRAAMISRLTSTRIAELHAIASPDHHATIARGIGLDARRKWLAPMRDRRALADVLSKLVPTDELPTVLRIRSASGAKIEATVRNHRGFCEWGLELAGDQFALREREQWLEMVAESEDLAEHVAAGRVRVEELDEAATRRWLASCASIDDGCRVDYATYEIVATEDDERPTVRVIDAGEAMRKRLEDAEAPTESPHEQLRAYHRQQAERERAGRVAEMREAFAAAMK